MRLHTITLLIILAAAAVFFFIRSYRPVTSDKPGRRFADLSIVFYCLYVAVVTVTYVSVTVGTLVAMSPGVNAAMLMLAAIATALLALSVFYPSWKRALRALRARRERRAARQAEEEIDAEHPDTVSIEQLFDHHQP